MTCDPPKPPQPQKPVRFIAQDIRRTASSATSCRCRRRHHLAAVRQACSREAAPGVPDLQELGITAWATWIHVDQDGQLLGRFSCSARIDGEDYTARRWASRYAQGIPFYGGTTT